jgi:pyruvate/2-oxoglutarate/acetoin dehydrogenase E1 component
VVASLQILRRAFYQLDAPIEIVAGLNIPVPFNLELEKACVPQIHNIVAAARRTLHLQPMSMAAE